MVDFGELTPDEVRLYDGRTGAAVHNAYVYDYHQAFNSFIANGAAMISCSSRAAPRPAANNSSASSPEIMSRISTACAPHCAAG